MEPMRGFARLLGLLALPVALAGCGTARGAVPIVNPVDASAMEPCNQAPLAFNGTSSLAALGLADQLGGGPDANKPGHVWITADPIVPEGWGAPPGAPPPEATRFVCVEWSDGSGMAGSIGPEWQLPADLAVAAEDLGAPLRAIGVLGLVLVGVVISVIAFRRP